MTHCHIKYFLLSYCHYEILKQNTSLYYLHDIVFSLSPAKNHAKPIKYDKLSKLFVKMSQKRGPWAKTKSFT